MGPHRSTARRCPTTVAGSARSAGKSEIICLHAYKLRNSMRKTQMKWFVLPIAGILVTTWIAVALQNRRIDNNALRSAGKGNTEDWLLHGLNYQEQRYSQLKQIDASNVKRLGLAFTYEIGVGGGNQEATPLVANGVLYSITNWSITYAVDVRTGKELWRYDPKVDRAFQPKIC